MSRDHRKLRVFHDAHSLTLAIYKQTRDFPKDYLKFLYIALGSACELKYLVGLAIDLTFLVGPASRSLADRCDHVVRQMQRLVESVEPLLASERRSRTRACPAPIAAGRRSPDA